MTIEREVILDEFEPSKWLGKDAWKRAQTVLICGQDRDRSQNVTLDLLRCGQYDNIVYFKEREHTLIARALSHADADGTACKIIRYEFSEFIELYRTLLGAQCQAQRKGIYTPRVAVVLDEIDQECLDSATYKNLLLNGHFRGISVFQMVPFVQAVPSSILSSMDHIVVTSSLRDRKDFQHLCNCSSALVSISSHVLETIVLAVTSEDLKGRCVCLVTETASIQWLGIKTLTQSDTGRETEITQRRKTEKDDPERGKPDENGSTNDLQSSWIGWIGSWLGLV